MPGSRSFGCDRRGWGVGYCDICSGRRGAGGGYSDLLGVMRGAGGGCSDLLGPDLAGRRRSLAIERRGGGVRTAQSFFSPPASMFATAPVITTAPSITAAPTATPAPAPAATPAPALLPAPAAAGLASC